MTSSDQPPGEGEAPAEPQPNVPASPLWEGEAPAEPLQRVPASRLRGSVALPQDRLALPNDRLALPVRKHPAHGIKYVEGQPTIIFDTLCVKQRPPILACDDFHRTFREVAADATSWLMGRYVIMPDHIHLFAGDAGGDTPYENWITYLKSQLTKQFLGGRGSRRAAAPHKSSTARQEPRPPDPTAGEPFRWLTDHWDTRVRTGDAYEQKWQYVLRNPVRAGLVARPEDWPYHGEIFELRWY